ncbi:hypothetical protein ILUMI_24201 [Ignelater luminosus]|uniref:Voltage-dependent calcium channel alpha-2/delta subunit conserved region domain-containing protein n=1 Tax=Ignelater luminosus TaxID=2038154 RepID=A0A8K0CCF3_IGNLU|nr:hypothetical protein ILUMI_24201 [Ignelater luminosus]
MNKHIASLVVNTILDTLSNNDYVNVMNFSEEVNYMVPCFENQIIQATEENIVILKDSLKTLEPERKSLLDIGLQEAFKLLHKYRKIRKCLGKSKYCNQAIMLVTDGIPNNVSTIINEYNRIANESSIPIRIFTFLVGKEASHLSDSIWIACSNRGFHSHVDALEQVTASVYKYIMVFARPLVLNGSNPLSWTHAYLDDTFEFGNKSSRGFEKYRLLTTVAGPVIDLKAKQLLGVVGTDVPVAEISKLMYLYKTGVNSHSFIVSNNGYVLKHPDLRPMFKDILTNNYNSIDLTEVEQLDDDTDPRQIGDILLRLRNATVKGEEGVIHDIKIKYHYDDMRRVSREINDYYYAPIKGTPFSIGFAIPDLYGNYSIEVADEIALRKFSSEPISDFFSGTNWKIHPHWAYCKYHYLEGHEFINAEKELIHFINEMKSNDFKWSLQYEDDNEQEQNSGCDNNKTLGKESYYCDRNLVKHLVFDARVTKPTFEASWRTQTTAANNLRLLYNATLRFVGTMSGLTRWEYIDIQPNGTKSFGDLHPRAIDETWYKSAVIQHRYNDRSFVYTVPFDSQEEDDILVTASSAIFPEQNGIASPAAVVGFQFSHSHLQKQFFSITTASHLCKGCLSCEAGLSCYIIDHSGYIVVSHKKSDTGVFFGEIDGNIMNATIEEGIFEKVTVRDYQAICYYDAWVSGDSSILTTPFNHLMQGAKWILGQIIWLTVKLNLNPLWDTNSLIIEAAEQAPAKFKSTATTKPKHKKKKDEEERWHEFNQIPQYKTEHAACEKERDLYVLQQQMFTDHLYPRLITPRPPSCFRPFYLKKIPHSNLLLIAIPMEEKPRNCPIIVHNTRLRDIVYENETDFPCQKLYLNKLYRQPLQGCFNDHLLEHTIVDCGRSTQIQFSVSLVIVSLLLLIQL